MIPESRSSDEVHQLILDGEPVQFSGVNVNLHITPYSTERVTGWRFEYLTDWKQVTSITKISSESAELLDILIPAVLANLSKSIDLTKEQLAWLTDNEYKLFWIINEMTQNVIEHGACEINTSENSPPTLIIELDEAEDDVPCFRIRTQQPRALDEAEQEQLAKNLRTPSSHSTASTVKEYGGMGLCTIIQGGTRFFPNSGLTVDFVESRPIIELRIPIPAIENTEL